MNIHPLFMAWFEPVCINVVDVVSEQVVWQIVPFLNNSNKGGILEGINSCWFHLELKWMIDKIYKIHINSYNSKNIKEPNTGIGIK